MQRSAENERLVVEMLRAVEERDGDRLAGILDPDVEFVWPPALPGYGGVHKGARAVARMGAAFTELWDPRQPTAAWRSLSARVIASNEREVVVHYHQRGCNPRGRTFDAEVLAVYEVEDARVQRLQMHYLDPLEARDFLNEAV